MRGTPWKAHLQEGWGGEASHIDIHGGQAQPHHLQQVEAHEDGHQADGNGRAAADLAVRPAHVRGPHPQQRQGGRQPEGKRCGPVEQTGCALVAASTSPLSAVWRLVRGALWLLEDEMCHWGRIRYLHGKSILRFICMSLQHLPWHHSQVSDASF